ncbi:MAG: preprotein translocase subunit YajC [Bacteroidetes bacterium]|nr:preprotein translocase subunit YajC [Bacteroidota bacterium]
MTNTLFSILLQAGGGYSSLIFPVLIVVVFYFFMIRPQLKKAKDQKKFRENIKVGDKVITIGGIHATILSIQETTFMISVEGGVKLKIEKNAVSTDSTALISAEPK